MSGPMHEEPKMGVTPWRETALLMRVSQHNAKKDAGIEILLEDCLRDVVRAVEQMRREDRVGLKIVLPDRTAPPFKYESNAFMRLFEEDRRSPLV
jgi:hypothetical protein